MAKKGKRHGGKPNKGSGKDTGGNAKAQRKKLRSKKRPSRSKALAKWGLGPAIVGAIVTGGVITPPISATIQRALYPPAVVQSQDHIPTPDHALPSIIIVLPSDHGYSLDPDKWDIDAPVPLARSIANLIVQHAGISSLAMLDASQQYTLVQDVLWYIDAETAGDILQGRLKVEDCPDLQQLIDAFQAPRVFLDSGPMTTGSGPFSGTLYLPSEEVRKMIEMPGGDGEQP